MTIPLDPPRTTPVSENILRGAGAFWFIAALLGQWAFFYYIFGFYGTSAVTGDFEIWNRLKALGRTPYVAGDTPGNLAYLAHALGAGIIAFGGALQLIPQMRKKAPTFHRWSGRLFLLTVTALSLSGFYLVWVRNTSPSLGEGISTTVNGVLILTFAALTLRTAMTRNIASHRRWAMRLWLVSNAQWFLRVGLFGYFIVGRTLGAKVGFGDPFLKFWTWGCFLVPLLALEIYLRARDNGGTLARVTTASGIVLLTLVMAAGIFGFSMFSHMIVTGAPLAFPG